MILAIDPAATQTIYAGASGNGCSRARMEAEAGTRFYGHGRRQCKSLGYRSGDNPDDLLLRLGNFGVFKEHEWRRRLERI